MLDLFDLLLPVSGADPDPKDSPNDPKDPPEDQADPKEKRITELVEELAREQTRRAEAEQAKSTAEQERDEAKNAQDGDVGKLQREVDSWKDKYAKLLEDTHENVIRTAVSLHEKYTWHDVDMVLERLDKKVLTVDTATGKVDGLEAQLKNVAKDKPFLLKGVKGEKDKEDQKPSPQGSTGYTPAGNGAQNRQGQEGQKSDKDLLKNYPALNNLV